MTCGVGQLGHGSELNSDTWTAAVKRLQTKQLPLTAALSAL
jgi:hypothetical protein